MKWIEKGIEFEGTVEEFRALHNMNPVAELPAVREAEEKKEAPRRKRERTGLLVEVTKGDGSSRVFPSMSAAFRWYVEEYGDQRRIFNAAAFRSKLGHEKGIYTEGIIFSLIEEEPAIENNKKGEMERAN